jgi:hypothetical protein
VVAPPLQLAHAAPPDTGTMGATMSGGN